ncbi:MAG TPA: alpha/beta hydrolase [Steroidobacteraceae bacterium]|nr:alpha/beta hydrolase [Steroidobacteraceae bacterium]
MTHVRKRSAVPNLMPATVNVRRSYADSRYGQLHVATAYPSGGGFDERSPLICLHQNGGSNRAFSPLLSELGRDRSVYAVDLPGHGGSDAVSGGPSIADFAGAIDDFVHGLRLRTYDLLGVEAGSLIAAELAASKGPQVRRVVFVSLPYPSQSARPVVRTDAQTSDASNVVAEEWQRFVQGRGAQLPASSLQTMFADHLRASGESALRNAMLDYPLAQRLPLVRIPTLVLCPNDEYREQTLRAKSCLSQSVLTELSEFGPNVMVTAPLKVAQLTREFLDR